ncbi:ABC transporter ATP-binding protein [Herminiimonas glaciei]|uniref:ABC transporter ATP-binding protein n=1 Tax=Herminiimonas glaciei TaxID=523788 RepID=A0ABW2I7H0_9BURK
MTKTSLPAIKLDGASKTFPLYASPLRQMLGYIGIGKRNVSSKLALDNISLEIGHGERVGIVGHNGSGKTTLLRLIIGYTQATSGTVVIDGDVQALMQTGYGFNDDLTGLENIRNALVYNGVSTADAQIAEEEIIDFVELGEFLHHPLKTYSLGMRARLEFAAATAISPDVLAIDEVLGAGDGYFVRKCALRMRHLMSKTTLLLVSHSLDQIREYCDRVIWLDGGKIRADGPVAETLQQYREYMNAQSERRFSESEAAGGKSTHNPAAPPPQLFDKIRALFSLTDPQAPFIREFSYANGESAKTLDIGAKLSLHLSTNDTPGLQPVILGFTDQGAFIFEFEINADGQSASPSTILNAERLGVGVGSYVLFPALRDPVVKRIVQVSNHPLNLQMAQTNWSDPPLVHLDGQWHSGNARVAIASKISGWV